VRNPDILAGLGHAPHDGTLLVGFAAETEDVIENARRKLASKKVDLIVANDVSEPNSGFSVDTNHVQLVDRTEVVDVPSAPKSEVAHRILDKLATMFGAEPVASRKAPRASKPKRK
jgi:phosphopantothenoylcysteine decarboxylase/phosphopantothenate--cysteine ligase